MDFDAGMNKVVKDAKIEGEGIVLAQRPELKPWEVPLQFVVHALVGALVFGIIAAVAFGIDRAVLYLNDLEANVVIIIGLKVAEFSLFTTDIALFLVFLWRTFWRTFRTL